MKQGWWHRLHRPRERLTERRHGEQGLAHSRCRAAFVEWTRSSVLKSPKRSAERFITMSKEIRLFYLLKQALSPTSLALLLFCVWPYRITRDSICVKWVWKMWGNRTMLFQSLMPKKGPCYGTDSSVIKFELTREDRAGSRKETGCGLMLVGSWGATQPPCPNSDSVPCWGQLDVEGEEEPAQSFASFSGVSLWGECSPGSSGRENMLEENFLPLNLQMYPPLASGKGWPLARRIHPPPGL